LPEYDLVISPKEKEKRSRVNECLHQKFQPKLTSSVPEKNSDFSRFIPSGIYLFQVHLIVATLPFVSYACLPFITASSSRAD